MATEDRFDAYWQAGQTSGMGLARHLEVPDSVIAKAPSAGLYEEQTDEDEMGFLRQLDSYLLTGEASEEVSQN